MMFQRPYMVIPTYNERETIEDLLRSICSIDPHYQCLVVDDDSPDGTHQIVSRLSAADDRIHLLHRTHQRGRGTAGIAGFLTAIGQGADAIVEMDADFSHHPRYIPQLLEELEGCDVVLGSRNITGGGETGRAASRQIITRLAGFFIRSWLRLPVLDPTSGFRAFRATVFEKINLNAMRSQGPSIVEELLYHIHQAGFRIKEIPILFEERRAGTSTLNGRVLMRTLCFVASIPFRKSPFVSQFR